MKKTLLFIPLLGLFTGCNTVNETLWAMQANREAIDYSTQAIEENRQAVEAANRSIAENKRQLEAINKTLQNVGG